MPFFRILILLSIFLLIFYALKNIFVTKKDLRNKEVYILPENNNSIFIELVCTVIGVGLGLLIAVLVNQSISADYREMFNIGVILIFGGLGMLAGNIIKKKF